MKAPSPAQSRSTFRPPSLSAVGAALAGPEPRGFERRKGAHLLETGARLPAAYLLTEGLVAIMARTPAGDAAEAGLVGPGGLIGHQAALGAVRASSDAVALTDVRGIALAPAALAGLREAKPDLHHAVMDYALARMAEVERLCACAARHSIEQRLARWLLTAAALLGDRPIEMTHERFSALFGVRRASVTTSLHLLEGDHAIRCRRGAVEIRDPARLEAASCGCHTGPWKA